MLTDLKKFTGRFLGKFAVKWTLKIPLHLAFVGKATSKNVIVSCTFFIF